MLESGNSYRWAMQVLSAINGRIVENNYWAPNNLVGSIKLIPLLPDNSIIERINQSGLLEIKHISERSLGNNYWVLGTTQVLLLFQVMGNCWLLLIIHKILWK